ncbi:MAG: XRE family transcriptional regulator, partial [Comamonadaceae bacterium]
LELEPLIAGGAIEAAAVAGEDAKAAIKKLRPAQLAKQKALDELIERKVATRDRLGRIARLVAARKLNGWDQEEAARRLGYANSTQLCLLESGAREIRLEHVVNFAKTYRCSTDYLLGRASSETEIEARTAVASRVVDGIRTVADALMQHMEAADKFHGMPTLSRYRELLEHARAVTSAARRVAAPALHAIAGGGTLAFAVEQLEDVVAEGARAVAGYEGKVQHLRDLLRQPAANDDYEVEKDG